MSVRVALRGSDNGFWPLAQVVAEIYWEKQAPASRGPIPNCGGLVLTALAAVHPAQCVPGGSSVGAVHAGRVAQLHVAAFAAGF